MASNPITKEQAQMLPRHGTPVAFANGVHEFFTFTFKHPFGPQVPITFRCSKGRAAIDRFNWFWSYERKELGLSRWAHFVRCAPAQRGRILSWIEVKRDWLLVDAEVAVTEEWILDALREN